jgi:hypothetical protein
MHLVAPLAIKMPATGPPTATASVLPPTALATPSIPEAHASTLHTCTAAAGGVNADSQVGRPSKHRTSASTGTRSMHTPALPLVVPASHADEHTASPVLRSTTGLPAPPPPLQSSACGRHVTWPQPLHPEPALQQTEHHISHMRCILSTCTHTSCILGPAIQGQITAALVPVSPARMTAQHTRALLPQPPLQPRDRVYNK